MSRAEGTFDIDRFDAQEPHDDRGGVAETHFTDAENVSRSAAGTPRTKIGLDLAEGGCLAYKV